MINSPLIVFLNTYGVVFLITFVILYEFILVDEKKLALNIIFSLITAFIFSLVLKELFVLPRPYLTNGGYPSAGVDGFSSLPSIHSALAFSLATSVIFQQKTLGVFLFGIAVLVGLGRILAGVHYPADVLVGMLIGVVVGVIINQALDS